jgi:hypothetical protein
MSKCNCPICKALIADLKREIKKLKDLPDHVTDVSKMDSGAGNEEREGE